jgi:hypothetical protein
LPVQNERTGYPYDHVGFISICDKIVDDMPAVRRRMAFSVRVAQARK